MKDGKYQILLTNDDSIRSPGLWAAAEVLGQLGYVTVVAPRHQSSGLSRSLPTSSDGLVEETRLQIGAQEWTVYSVGGTPAQTVQHAVLSVLPALPDLVVSGINYGENPGTDITASGTVGAALEAAAMGIPAMAISLQLDNVCEDYLSHSNEFDFSTAAYFTRLLAEKLLRHEFPAEVDLLNVNVPYRATLQTPWHLTRQAHQRYFRPSLNSPEEREKKGTIGACVEYDLATLPHNTDIYTMAVLDEVSVSPLTLDMTAAVDLAALEQRLKN
jgi:5'-nucleotidase